MEPLTARNFEVAAKNFKVDVKNTKVVSKTDPKRREKQYDLSGK